MISTTPMPAAGLRRANQVHTDDVVVDESGEMWRVHSVAHCDHDGDDCVTFTMRNVYGMGRVETWPGATWMRLARRPETAQEYRRRVVGRAMPWFVLGIAVAVVASVSGAPAAGGQWVLIIGAWLMAAVRMVTTPEQER